MSISLRNHKDKTHALARRVKCHGLGGLAARDHFARIGVHLPHNSTVQNKHKENSPKKEQVFILPKNPHSVKVGHASSQMFPRVEEAQAFFHECAKHSPHCVELHSIVNGNKHLLAFSDARGFKFETMARYKV